MFNRLLNFLLRTFPLCINFIDLFDYSVDDNLCHFLLFRLQDCSLGNKKYRRKDAPNTYGIKQIPLYAASLPEIPLQGENMGTKRARTFYILDLNHTGSFFQVAQANCYHLHQCHLFSVGDGLRYSQQIWFTRVFEVPMYVYGCSMS